LKIQQKRWKISRCTGWRLAVDLKGRTGLDLSLPIQQIDEEIAVIEAGLEREAALAVSNDQERLFLATGRYIGEGFDGGRRAHSISAQIMHASRGISKRGGYE
jgi:hypothetical protein